MHGSAPDWSKIFEKIPDLESPGYRETLEAVRLNKDASERQKLADQMQQINKEKQSQKNKNRSSRGKGSAVPNVINSSLSLDKGRRK